MSRPPTNAPLEIDPAGEQSVATHLAIHDVRFENGQKTFAELREEINKLKATTTPKPIQWQSLLLGGFGVVAAILGAIWTLQGLFSDRPTRAELKETTLEQRGTLQEQSKEIRSLRDQQIEQRVLLNGVSTEVKETSRKIDVLINSSPRATGNPRTARTPKSPSP